MNIPSTSTLEFAKLFARAARDIIKISTGEEVEVSKSAVQVNGVQITGPIGSFVSFWGDYSGLMVLNFDGDAALEIVVASLTAMGLPEEDMPKHHSSDDVRNSVGELSNQIVGKCRSLVEEKYDLTAFANIPAVVPISTPISLSMVSKEPSDLEAIRISYTTKKRNRFHMELALEPLLVKPLDI